MRELTLQEQKLFKRYLKLTQLYDRFIMFKRARESSNAMLNVVEATFLKQSPSDYQLTYLQGISRRKSKNYRKLRGMTQLIRVIDALKQKTLTTIRLGENS